MRERILFVTNSGRLDGGSRDLISLLRRLSSDGIEPVVVLAEAGLFGAEVEKLGVKTVRISQPAWLGCGTMDSWLYSMRLLPKAVEEIRSVIRKENISGVVTNASVIPAGALAAAIEGVPHLWIAREFVGQGGMVGPLDATLVHGCMGALSARVVCVSEALATAVAKTINLEKVAVVHSGIDTGWFARCAPDHDNHVIVSVGTTTPEKGLDDLVEAACILAEDNLSFTVRVVGDFDLLSYKEKVEKRLLSLGIQQHFQFINFQKDIRPCLDRAAVACMPSHAEGMGMTIVEAMAAGLPVVATDCGGPRDLIDHDQTGLLVPVGSPDTLAGALRRILADTNLAAAMGQAGRMRARQRFDADATVPLMIEHAENTVAAKPDTNTAPLAALLLQLLSISGPRILLGKKWRLLQLFERCWGK